MAYLINISWFWDVGPEQLSLPTIIYLVLYVEFFFFFVIHHKGWKKNKSLYLQNEWLYQEKKKFPELGRKEP